jgi:hypothetical protein
VRGSDWADLALMLAAYLALLLLIGAVYGLAWLLGAR